MPAQIRVHHGAYLDSLLLMATTVAMEEVAGTQWAGAVMATPRGLAELADAGFASDDLTGLSANDLVLAVRADEPAAIERAFEAGRQVAFETRTEDTAEDADRAPRSLAEAAAAHTAANVAIISVPGEYAAIEAHHALTAGMHVLLFSDGVPVEEEVELKVRAAAKGLLLMGPGAGTAVLAGTGLGFANALGRPRADAAGRGAVGVVAAAGTGAQEVSTLLDRWGVPVSQVIGVGGRDLTEAVGGGAARVAVRALSADPATSVILLVSKPPAAAVARAVLAESGAKPTVAVFLGLDGRAVSAGAGAEPTLEQGARRAAEIAGGDPVGGASLRSFGAAVATAAQTLSPGRETVRGLFSGGTLCYEAQLVLGELLGPVYSNEPLQPGSGLPAPDRAHVLLDLGAEEFTRGVPHPMIDPTNRLERLSRIRDDPDVAVVLLDVVLGHGSHPDPAGLLAPICAAVMADGGPRVVAYVLGTERDPQVYSRQKAALESVGALVPDTNAQAARVAAAIAARRPELAAQEQNA